MNKTLVIVQQRVNLEEPHNCTDSKDVLTILSALFDALVQYDDHLGYAPALAESWTLSDDALTWTFRLREDVYFHNGDACDAEAVKYSLERMARPDMGVTLGAPGVYHQYLNGMQVEVLDQHTVCLTTATPVADLLDVLVTGYILPPGPVEQLGADFRLAPVGTGPYEFVSSQPGEEVCLKRNDRSFSTLPKYERVIWRAVPDPTERVRMVQAGHAHIAATLPPAAVSESSGLQILRSQGTTAFIIIFSANKGPLKNPLVRRALNLGIDRQVIIDQILGGAGYPLTGFVSPHHFGYDPDQPPLTFDPEQAKTLLKQAGYEHGLTLTLDSPTALPNEAVPLSKIVTEQWRQIGVEVKVVYTEDREAYANKVRLKDIHDMCIFDSSPLSTYRVLKEKIDARFEGSWWEGYHNAEVEQLLDTAETTIDEASREAIYQKCFQILNEDPPWLYLYNYETFTGVSADLARWQLPAHGVIDPKVI